MRPLLFRLSPQAPFLEGGLAPEPVALAGVDGAFMPKAADHDPRMHANPQGYVSMRIHDPDRLDGRHTAPVEHTVRRAGLAGDPAPSPPARSGFRRGVCCPIMAPHRRRIPP